MSLGVLCPRYGTPRDLQPGGMPAWHTLAEDRAAPRQPRVSGLWGSRSGGRGAQCWSLCLCVPVPRGCGSVFVWVSVCSPRAGRSPRPRRPLPPHRRRPTTLAQRLAAATGPPPPSRPVPAHLGPFLRRGAPGAGRRCRAAGGRPRPGRGGLLRPPGPSRRAGSTAPPAAAAARGGGRRRSATACPGLCPLSHVLDRPIRVLPRSHLKPPLPPRVTIGVHHPRGAAAIGCQ